MQTMASNSSTEEKNQAENDFDEYLDGGVDGSLSSTIELEEWNMEDPDALSELITQKMTEHQDEVLEDHTASTIPSAYYNWKMPSNACLRRLKKEGVSFKEPKFKTPLVDTPVLLEGPIDGVEIVPHWQRKNRVNSVMDCHLALALVAVARLARYHGIRSIQYYSTYRPLKVPPRKCDKGKAGRKCRKAKQNYERARSDQKSSQHRRALAIDIRWFITENDDTIDVLEHFDRRSHKDPCSYNPRTREARVLTRIVCDLHRDHIFSVVLTPNANKAHHNHLHLDITPGVRWSIVR